MAPRREACPFDTLPSGRERMREHSDRTWCKHVSDMSSLPELKSEREIWVTGYTVRVRYRPTAGVVPFLPAHTTHPPRRPTRSADN